MAEIDEQLGSFQFALSRFDSSLFNEEISKNINEISNWVKEQKESSAEKGDQDRINNVRKVLTSTSNAIEKFQSGDPFQIASGTLDIISSASVLVGGPYGGAVAALCSIIGAILSASQAGKPNVVEQLAKVVHSELVNFHEKLQGEKFEGLRDRIKGQIFFLKKKLPDLKDTETLWEDYTQFLGEVSNRYESSIPFKFDDDLTKDADVADVVTALVMYCKAYTCLMAFLTTAKGKFGDLGDSKSKEMIEKIDNELQFQKDDAKEKLAFLSDGKYLTFLGRLPSEGGKLTKIVALKRTRGALRQVEEVRRSLNLTPMADLATIESAAAKVSRQSVKLKLERHPVSTTENWIQVINETKFPMKIVSGTVGGPKGNLQFEQNLEHRSSHERYTGGSFSTGGYLILDEQIIEFALLDVLLRYNKINVANKTNSESSKGFKTYNDMQDGETKIEYWVQGGVHYMARADIVKFTYVGTSYEEEESFMWRFIVQDFDPATDVVDG